MQVNMKSVIFYALLFLTAGTTILSCKKKESVTPVTCTAGSGGTVSFHAALFHHAVLIPNDSTRPDTVWVKYCESGWNNDPSTYDAHFIGTPGTDSVFITGLKPGQYFFRASGFDTNINLEVTGGLGASCDGSTSIVYINIPVVE